LNTTLKPLFTLRARIAYTLLVAAFMGACASKKSVPERPADLRDKRVALTEISGSADVRQLVEVALVNELLENGRFEIVDRPSTLALLAEYPTPQQWPALARKLDAQLYLTITARHSAVSVRTGFDEIEESDSVLAEEHREPGKKARRYQRVRGKAANVELVFRFFDSSSGALLIEGIGQSSREANSREGPLPGSLSLLESLVSEAVRSFFESPQSARSGS
jgi:hypothetical protein